MRAAGQGEAAVVGVGICGLGLEDSGAFLDRMLRNRAPGKEQDQDPGRLAMAAAAEAHAGAGVWEPARCGLFLSLADAPGEGLERLGGALRQRFGLLGRGGACLGQERGWSRVLNAAVRRIRAGALDGALVGAVQVWPAAPGSGSPSPAGMAVFLALRRMDLAERSGDRIWAVLGAGPDRERRVVRYDPGSLIPGGGESMSGLLQVAAGCLMAGHHAWYDPEERCGQPFLDRTDSIGFTLEVESAEGARLQVDLWRSFHPGPAPLPLLTPPGIAAYAGATPEDLIQRVLMDEQGGSGPVRLAVLSRGAQERQEVLDRIPRLLQQDGLAGGWLEPGICFSPAPVRGKVACLFTSCATGYPGMGRELLLGMPFLPALIRPFRDLAPADWIYGAHGGRSGDPLYEHAGTMFLSQVHAAFTRDLLGLQPDWALGLSQGEINALLAYGAWTPKGGEFEFWKRGGLHAKLLSAAPEAARRHWGLPEGAEIKWRNWTVLGPVGQVLERAAAEERAYVSIVYSPVHCLLAGEAEACRRVLAGCTGVTAFLTVGIADHTPVLGGLRAAWYRHHYRPTRPVAGIEFYSHHFGNTYALRDDRVAAALTEQLLEPLDFPTAAWRAWDSGVRIFIEHGPRNLLTTALTRLLPRQEGVFLALDVQGENPLTRAVKVAAELWCRGVPVDLGRLQAALDQCRLTRPSADPLLEVAASLFAASLERTGTLDGAYRACLHQTGGRFLEFLGMPAEEGLDL